MSAEPMPQWAHYPVTAEQYDAWSEEQSAGIEIVDGMVSLTPSPSIRHNLIAEAFSGSLRAAGRPEWLAAMDFDVRLRDVPLLNRRPDVTVFRAERIDTVPMRPEHILLIVEIVSPGSESVDRRYKAEEYADARIPHYWRVERATTGTPVVYTFVLDPAGPVYRAGEVFTGTVKTSVPYPVEIDLRDI
jgi:Uma2 family endonuclease